MITKFKTYNESIRHLLVGPNKEDFWNYSGYKPFDTPEDYLDVLLDGIIHYDMSGDEVWWEKNGKLMINVDNSIKRIYLHEKQIYNIFKYVFELSEDEMKELLKEYNIISGLQNFKIEILDSYGDEDDDYENYNESIRDLLVGPTKEESWKSFGFDRTFDTPEEYFLYLTDGVEIISPNGLYYEWRKGGRVLFEQYLRPNLLIFMKYSDIKVFDKIFNMQFMEVTGFREFCKFMKKMFDKYFDGQINMDVYQIRIEYGK